MSEERWKQLLLFGSVVVLVFGAMTYGAVLLAEDVKLERKAYRDEVAARKDRWLVREREEEKKEPLQTVPFDETLERLGAPSCPGRDDWEPFEPIAFEGEEGSGTVFYTTAHETSLAAERLALSDRARDEWLDWWMAMAQGEQTKRHDRQLDRWIRQTDVRSFEEERVTVLSYEWEGSVQDVTAYWTDRLGKPDRSDRSIHVWVRDGRLYVQRDRFVQITASLSDTDASSEMSTTERRCFSK